MTFGWEYPPGVTGGEYAIAGADFEEDVPGRRCGNGHAAVVREGYRGSRWLVCAECEWREDEEPADEVNPWADSDDAMDRAREREEMREDR